MQPNAPLAWQNFIMQRVGVTVSSSLTLVAMGSSDPTRRVLPSNLELWQTPQQSWDPFWIRLPYPVMYRAHHVRSWMMCKIIFTAPFFVPVERSRFASFVVTPRGYKAGGLSCATYISAYDLPQSLHLFSYG
jgi:hypothetical protein